MTFACLLCARSAQLKLHFKWWSSRKDPHIILPSPSCCLPLLPCIWIKWLLPWGRNSCREGKFVKSALPSTEHAGSGKPSGWDLAGTKIHRAISTRLWECWQRASSLPVSNKKVVLENWPRRRLVFSVWPWDFADLLDSCLLKPRGSLFGWLIGLDLMLLFCYMNMDAFFLVEDESAEMKRDSVTHLYLCYSSKIKQNTQLPCWNYNRLTYAQHYICVNPPSLTWLLLSKGGKAAQHT